MRVIGKLKKIGGRVVKTRKNAQKRTNKISIDMQPTQKRQRLPKGKVYWYVSLDANKGGSTVPRWYALSARELYDFFDDAQYAAGNYYLTPDEAKEEAARRNKAADEEAGRGEPSKRRGRPKKSEEPSPKVESEKDVERYLVNQASSKGWIPLKYSSGITTGYPDRCILLPGGITVWVEVKTTGMKPSALQKVRLKQLSGMGFIAVVIDSRAQVDRFFQQLQKMIIDNEFQTS